MATVTCIDYRRTDERINVLPNPYWITSDLMVGDDCEDLAALLFSFPNAGEQIYIHAVAFQVVAAFTAGTTIDIGQGTIATNAITTGGLVTTVDVDDYIKNADVTVGTPGWYVSITGNTSDWLTAKVAQQYVNPVVLTGAAATVPVVAVYMANAGAIAAGTGRVYMLISRIPGSGS